ncbi:hypothetical protein HPMG_00840 [Helicobacter pullorum MIT 98-5489]|uniref:Uncharacterized protein n=1 Tax=Helicobacter pullorum MIT 98-5489 TaxID=537972 RepID=C5EYN5_9HELI|nr:hypothetical protein HPMG_00840 [Helicobacter pullorum MIT 98-5489]
MSLFQSALQTMIYNIVSTNYAFCFCKYSTKLTNKCFIPKHTR